MKSTLACRTIINAVLVTRPVSKTCWRACSSDSAVFPNDPKPLRAEWFGIGGFTRFASRRDLEIALGDLKPLKADPILDTDFNTTGRWAVLLPVTNVSIVKNALAAQNLKATCAMLSKDGHNNLKLASRCGISDHTVRLKNVPAEVGIEELRFFLQDYNLDDGPNAITPLQGERERRQPFHQYFVNFATAEDAERVVLEKCYSILEGAPIQMIWYNC